MTGSEASHDAEHSLDRLLAYLEALGWTPEKGDQIIRWELAKYPELIGMRKVIITLCATRTDPATGTDDVAISTDPATTFAEIAKFAFMFALVAGHRMAHSGVPEPMTPEKQNQLVSLEMDNDPAAIATLAELYRAGLVHEQDDYGFTALELLQLEFERDERSEIYLAAWAGRAEQITRDFGGKSVTGAEQAGRDLEELWSQIYSVGIFAGMGLCGRE